MGAVITINRTVTDFVAKTRHLSVEDRGAYQEILDQIVLLGQDEDPPSLPDDDRLIANFLGWSAKKWRSTRERLCTGPMAVLIAEGGRLSQTRIVEEIEAAKVRMGIAVKAGKASGEARRKLRERMLNGSSTDVAPQLNSKGNSKATQGEPVTSHESRVMKLPTETSSPSVTASESPARDGVTAVTTPDFAAVKMLAGRIEALPLASHPGEQLVITWLSRFGSGLIEETLADPQLDLTGKSFQYLASILERRHEHPEQRPRRRNGGATRGVDPSLRVGATECGVTSDDVREVRALLKDHAWSSHPFAKKVPEQRAREWLSMVLSDYANDLTQAPSLLKYAESVP